MSDLRPNQQVEWARLLWFKYEVLAHFFRYAACLEKNGYFIEASARKSDLDNWTLHLSEGLLSENEDWFNSFVSQAPLRAVILARVLQRSLDDETDSSAGDNAQTNGYERRFQLEKRIELLNAQTILSAQETLIARLNEDSEESAEFDFALKLLLLIGTEAQLSSLPLSTVNLANEPHSSAVIGKLGAVTTLEALNLSQTQISREGTGFLAKLENLRKLDLSDTRVMSSSLTPLRNLRQLEELNVAGTQVNDTSLATFGFLTGLKSLDLRNSALAVSKDAIEKLLPDCKVIA